MKKKNDNFGQEFVNGYINSINAKRNNIFDMENVQDTPYSYLEKSYCGLDYAFDDDEYYEDKYYDDECDGSCHQTYHGLEGFIKTIEINSLLSDKDKKQIKEKFMANVEGRLRKLRYIQAGDVLFIPDTPDSEEGEKHLVISIGMYCDCCGTRYRDVETNQFADEMAEIIYENLPEWKVLCLGPGKSVNMHSMDMLIFRNAKIESHMDGLEVLNNWN